MSKAIQCNRCKLFATLVHHRATTEIGIVEVFQGNWISLMTGDDVVDPQSAKHLCPKCKAAFVQFMDNLAVEPAVL